MPLIVDTYNVLHVVGVLPPDLAGIDVGGLISLIGTSRYRDDQVILVCDGTPRPDRGGGAINVRIRYSGPRSTADDLITALIRTSSTPRRLTVVSSDHAILRAARRRRCKLLESPQFLRRLADDRHVAGEAPDRKAAENRPPGSLPDPEVAKWARLFDLDPAAPLPELPPEPEPTDPAEAEPSGPAKPPSADAEPRVEPVLPDDILREAESIWERGFEA